MKYVIIGNFAAGIGAVEGIRQIDKKGEITILSNEPYHTYSRPLISYFLQGKIDFEKMKYRPSDFYTKNNVKLLFKEVVSINNLEKNISLANGEKIIYDKLLVATGSYPFIPPTKGIESVQNRFTFSSFSDAAKISENLSKDKQVLIIGAGLIGLKAAEGVVEKVKSVTVIDISSRLLSTVLDEKSSRMLQNHLEKQKIKFKLSGKIMYFDKNTAILEDNEEIINFDILIIAAGVRPNVKLLSKIAKINRGIIVNDKSETSEENIYAAGDCTETFDISSQTDKIMALLPNAYIQGETAGINMAGGDKSFKNAIPMNSVGFFGLHIMTAGTYDGEIYESVTGDYDYKKLFYSDNYLNGYIVIGNTLKAGIYTNLIRERIPLDTTNFSQLAKNPTLMAFKEDYRKEKLGSELC